MQTITELEQMRMDRDSAMRGWKEAEKKLRDLQNELSRLSKL
jgi:hypothetical protein